MAKERLDSWKAIAEYLRRSPRTVQRWHAEYGLPVHRFGGAKGPVFSYSSELDAWLSGFSEEPSADAGGQDRGSGARKHNSQELTAQAEELWELRSDENLGAIATLYRRAMDLDPADSTPFVGLANVLILATLTGNLHSSSAYPRAGEALRRVVRLGLDSAEAQCATAWLLMVRDRNWKASRAAFDESIRRQPRSSFALSGRALLHIAEGHLAEASRYLRDAWRENAFASASNAFLYWTQYLAGDCSQALEAIAQSRSSGESSSLTNSVEALALIQAGPVDFAVERIESIAASDPKNLVLLGALGYAYAIVNQRPRAQQIAESLKRFQGEIAYPLALVLMGLDARFEALPRLEQSFEEGSLWSLGFRFDPVFQPLMGDHHFELLLRKLAPSV